MGFDDRERSRDGLNGSRVERRAMKHHEVKEVRRCQGDTEGGKELLKKKKGTTEGFLVFFT